jgi:hypothetical protein
MTRRSTAVAVAWCGPGGHWHTVSSLWISPEGPAV